MAATRCQGSVSPAYGPRWWGRRPAMVSVTAAVEAGASTYGRGERSGVVSAYSGALARAK